MQEQEDVKRQLFHSKTREFSGLLGSGGAGGEMQGPSEKDHAWAEGEAPNWEALGID